MTATTLAKSAYVAGMRAADGAGAALGMGCLLNRHACGRIGQWLRSLTAIHDVDALIALDVPWWTYGAIAEVDAFLSARAGRARVFEFGSGASTVWLARRAASVTSVEHHEAWLGTVRDRTADREGVRLRLVPAEPLGRSQGPDYGSAKEGYAGTSFERYARSIEDEEGAFDLIVIDGRARGACLRHALPKLAEGGLVVFDNTRRRRYRAAIDAHPVRARYFRGLAPSLPFPDETALLCRA